MGTGWRQTGPTGRLLPPCCEELKINQASGWLCRTNHWCNTSSAGWAVEHQWLAITPHHPQPTIIIQFLPTKWESERQIETFWLIIRKNYHWSWEGWTGSRHEIWLDIQPIFFFRQTMSILFFVILVLGFPLLVPSISDSRCFAPQSKQENLGEEDLQSFSLGSIIKKPINTGLMFQQTLSTGFL